MNDVIVDSSEPITLVGGGQATVEALQEALTLAPVCVAADGGLRLALSAGVEVAALIGDFDSVTDAELDQVPQARRHQIHEQMSTDFEKALLRVQAPAIVGVGFLGGRIDHQLAAFHALMVFAHRPCLLLGETEIVFLAPPDFYIDTQPGDVVSLVPLDKVRGISEGLEWPIEGLKFRQGQKIGTSNRATGPVRLQMEAPNMLTILPRRLMRSVVSRLSEPKSARWPAPPG